MNHYQKEIAEKNLNDYRYTTIKYENEDEIKLKPFHTIYQFFNSYNFLLKTLNNIDKNKYRKIVVITHHTPLNNSIPKRFKGNPVNCCFTTHIPELVNKADIWIHGHTHDSFDYLYNNTRGICNPRGYVGYQINPYFKNGFMIEI